MIEQRDLSALAKSNARITREYVAAEMAEVLTAHAVLMERVKTLEDLLTDLPPGPKGKDGIDGKDGIPGKDGIEGKDGLPGADGGPGPRGERGEPGLSIKGDPGTNGVDGKDGRDGRDGIAKDGRDGIDGKDAADIRPLDTIDLEKSFPRGTWATYRGGLWLARETTRPGSIEKSGWEVVIDGYPDFDVIQGEDLRTFSFQVTRTNGVKFLRTFSLPALIYRGIYAPDQEYARGDVVTYSGGAFHCEAEKTQSRPETSKDWKLMVKRGADGKGLIGPEGPKGKDGKDGRDLRPVGSYQ
jgi:Collagen triple helix repeat (20 copies).